MTSLDKIDLKFQFIEIPKEQRSQYNSFHSQLSLKFSLNGQEFNTPIDNYVLIDSINDHRWGDNNEYSEFYIITCSCGVPSCNNIHNGIFIESNEDTITWKIPPDEGYEKYLNLFSKDTYIFDKNEYIKTFSLLPQVLEKVTKNGWNNKDISFNGNSSLQDIVDYKPHNK